MDAYDDEKKVEDFRLEDVQSNTNPPTSVGPVSKFSSLTTRETIKKFWRLYAIGLAVGWAAIYMGFTLGIASNVIVNKAFIKQFGTIRGPDGELSLDADHVAVWGGLNFAAQMVFQALSPLTADRFGVRVNLYILTVAMLIAIIIEIFSKNWIHYLIAKIFSGMACAYIGPGIINYLTEISLPQIRGAMVSSFAFCFALGGLGAAIALRIIEGIQPLRFRTAFYCQFAILGPWLLVLLLIPESPIFLCRAGKHDKAKKSLRRLIGNVDGYDVDYEYSVIEHEVEQSQIMAKTFSQSGWLALFVPKNLARSLIGCLPFVLQPLSGTALIFGYSTFFFALSGLGDAFLGTVILNCVLLLGIVVAIFTVDYLGRRTLVLIGCSGCIASMLVFGGLGQLPIGPVTGNIVLGMACLWNLFYASSLATVGWGYLGEVCNLTLRSKTIALGTVLQSSVSIVFQFTAPIMLSPQKAGWGVRIGFLYAGLTAIGMTLVYLFLPETKGRTAAEMDELYESGVPARKFHKVKTEVQRAREEAGLVAA